MYFKFVVTEAHLAPNLTLRSMLSFSSKIKLQGPFVEVLAAPKINGRPAIFENVLRLDTDFIFNDKKFIYLGIQFSFITS